MKKSLGFNLAFLGVWIFSGFSLALAQVPPTQQTTSSTPITNEPIPKKTPTLAITQQTMPTSTSGSATNTTTATGTKTGTSPRLTPDLTTIDLGTINVNPSVGSTEQTGIDQNNPQCKPNPEQSQCLTTENVNSIMTPKISGNQIKMMLIMTLGALIGFAFSLFAMRFSGQNTLSRDQRSATRKLKQALQNKKQVELMKTYNHIADAIANIGDPDGHKKYLAASSELELFGSKGTRDANKNFMAMISQPTKQPDEIMATRRALIKSFKTDLGLT